MKKETKQKLIYLRYILPPVLIILVLLLGFVPSYRYVVTGEAHESVSLWSLIGDSWTLGRETLFAKSNATTGEQAFSKITLGWIIGSALLYLVALASAAWACGWWWAKIALDSWRDPFPAESCRRFRSKSDPGIKQQNESQDCVISTLDVACNPYL